MSQEKQKGRTGLQNLSDMFNGTESQDVCFNGIESHAVYFIGQSHKMCIFKVIFSMLSEAFWRCFHSYCSTTGKPTRSFATERVSLDSV